MELLVAAAALGEDFFFIPSLFLAPVCNHKWAFCVLMLRNLFAIVMELLPICFSRASSVRSCLCLLWSLEQQHVKNEWIFLLKTYNHSKRRRKEAVLFLWVFFHWEIESLCCYCNILNQLSLPLVKGFLSVFFPLIYSCFVMVLKGGFQTLSSNPQLFILSSFQKWDLQTMWDSREASNTQKTNIFIVLLKWSENCDFTHMYLLQRYIHFFNNFVFVS